VSETADLSTKQFPAFVDRAVTEFDRLPAALRGTEEPMHLELTLTIDPDAQKRAHDRFAAVGAGYEREVGASTPKATPRTS
jgi:hypothetical protein